MNTNLLRPWATPLTIGAFLLMATTGILMFFHIELGLAKVAHEWLSWIMLSAVGMHIVLNWRAFSRYFTQKVAVAVVALFVVLTLTALFIPNDKQGRPGPMQAVEVLLDAPLDKLAGITGKSWADLQAQLASQGLPTDDPTTSLRQLASTQQRNPMDVLGKALK